MAVAGHLPSLGRDPVADKEVGVLIGSDVYWKVATGPIRRLTGPVVASTRSPYEKQLQQLLNNGSVPTTPSVPTDEFYATEEEDPQVIPEDNSDDEDGGTLLKKGPTTFFPHPQQQPSSGRFTCPYDAAFQSGNTWRGHGGPQCGYHAAVGKQRRMYIAVKVLLVKFVRNCVFELQRLTEGFPSTHCPSHDNPVECIRVLRDNDVISVVWGERDSEKISSAPKCVVRKGGVKRHLEDLLPPKEKKPKVADSIEPTVNLNPAVFVSLKFSVEPKVNHKRSEHESHWDEMEADGAQRKEAEDRGPGEADDELQGGAENEGQSDANEDEAFAPDDCSTPVLQKMLMDKSEQPPPFLEKSLKVCKLELPGLERALKAGRGGADFTVVPSPPRMTPRAVTKQDTPLSSTTAEPETKSEPHSTARSYAVFPKLNTPSKVREAIAFKVGDVVIVEDDNTPRLLRKLGWTRGKCGQDVEWRTRRTDQTANLDDDVPMTRCGRLPLGLGAAAWAADFPPASLMTVPRSRNPPGNDAQRWRETRTLARDSAGHKRWRGERGQDVELWTRLANRTATLHDDVPMTRCGRPPLGLAAAAVAADFPPASADDQSPIPKHPKLNPGETQEHLCLPFRRHCSSPSKFGMLRLSVYAAKHHQSFAPINIIHNVEMRYDPHFIQEVAASGRRRFLLNRAYGSCHGLSKALTSISSKTSIIKSKQATQELHRASPNELWEAVQREWNDLRDNDDLVLHL
ncbi:hypothetical protein HPB47_012990 [Ixodes persulcatus]|uniref:Uncharacterized protein n=1 Tax=Ixodes persulcatus TaxID=34615 RepID=A0AC60NS13_IXOPE|nr:hypothetical protein HPB47_012990 [Ixodes persulcatus]